MRRLLRDYVRYPLEVVGAVVAYAFFAVLPTDAASGLGGWIGRAVGPRLAIHRRALRHIALAMPETDAAAREAIARDMWDNFGRMVGEYPHITTIARDPGRGGRVEVTGAEHLDLVRPADAPGILFSAHLANIELFSPLLSALGVDYAQVYRPPSNPLMHRLLLAVRGLPEELRVPKGTAGARKAIEILKSGGELGMLVDQKMNDGISVPFFGHAAMTAPAIAQLGLKYGCAIIPVQLERLVGCRFRLTFLPPLEPPATGDPRRDVEETMIRINRLIEDWVRAQPGQWFWLHRRWPRDAMPAAATASATPSASDRREAPDRAVS